MAVMTRIRAEGSRIDEGAKDAGHRPRGSDHRRSREVRGPPLDDERLRHHGAGAGEEVEQKEAAPPQAVLHRGPEEGEIQHVADQVEQPRMHEAGGDRGEERRRPGLPGELVEEPGSVGQEAGGEVGQNAGGESATVTQGRRRSLTSVPMGKKKKK